MNPLAELRDQVQGAAAALRVAGEAPSAAASLERPKQDAHGDYSTNAALLLAPVLGRAPRDIAEGLGEELAGTLGAQLDNAQVAGPGFLNLVMADLWFHAALTAVLEAGERWGAVPAVPAERVLVEFVSANPTGPLTAAGGRHAAYGDALARVLEFVGHDVSREYYVNDFGTQIRKLGESIQARALGTEIPEGGYEGEYVRELAAALPESATADPDELARLGVALMLEKITATLEAYGVHMDAFFSERSLHEGDEPAIARAEATLEAAGNLYRSDGAVWVRTTTFGDDKDRVLRRSSGEPTYFASDVAYHADKRARGFDRLIDVWGADHHGYVKRMHAAWESTGGAPDALELVIMQFVTVIERGERASMSKRRGEFITLDDLIAEIGVDAARFLLLMRSHDTTVDLDLDQARDESAENPVYYVQYAHARIQSILGRAGEERMQVVSNQSAWAGADSLEPAERALLKTLLAFPEEVAEAVSRRAPHRIAVYALELAQAFTAFYRDCRVLGAEPEATESLRLALSLAAQRTIACALGLLGVSAPRSM